MVKASQSSTIDQRGGPCQKCYTNPLVVTQRSTDSLQLYIFGLFQLENPFSPLFEPGYLFCWWAYIKFSQTNMVWEIRSQ